VCLAQDPPVNAGTDCRRYSAIGAPTHAMALGFMEGDLVLLELLEFALAGLYFLTGGLY
jgi:hypothetical protein